MKQRKCWLWGTLAVAAIARSLAMEPEPSSASTVKLEGLTLTDSHVHVFDGEVSSWLESELGLTEPLQGVQIDALLQQMQSDGVRRASLLSNAYFFGKDTPKHPADTAKLAAQNDYIASLARQYPQQLAGFFSLNPLADSALAELRRCARSGIFTGLKLHLANSEADLRNPVHVQRLGEIFAAANESQLVVIIHLRTERRDYGREDAQIFIDQVLPKAAKVPVQIAHLAGWGGYDPATDAALTAFADRAEKLTKAQRRSDRVYYDISAVVRQVGKSQPRVDWFPEGRYARAAMQLRRIGLQRVLFGTDWPEWSPRDYARDLQTSLPLTAAELRILLTNRPPWLKN